MKLIKHFVFGMGMFLLWWLVPSAVVAKEMESQSYHLSDGTQDRTYRLYSPPSLHGKLPVPLVIVLHGGFGSSNQAENSYNWDALADQQGFMVVYPNGLSHSWNAGGICCGPALRKNVNDVGFLTRLIETISKSENIDSKRVYITGISNGAAMAYRYACEGTYSVAAIGSVAGSFSYPCSNPHPISVMAIHGLDDQHIPFAGGAGTKGVTEGSWMSVQQSLDLFRRANDCQPSTYYKEGLLQTEVSSCEKGHEVKLITIEGAGHQWPGGKSKTGFIQRILELDQPSTALDATTKLWEFFQNHAEKP